MLLSPCAFNLWLPHWPEGCGSCISHRNRDAGRALLKPLAGWPRNRTPAQSRVQLRNHVPHLSLTQSGTTPVPQELWPWCRITHFWCLPSELSKLFFPIYLREDSQWLPEVPFLPHYTSSERHLFTEAVRVCSVLSSRFRVSTNCTSSDKQLPLAQVNFRVHLLWALPFTLCITILFAQQQPEKFDCTVSIPYRLTTVCSIYNLVQNFCIF